MKHVTLTLHNLTPEEAHAALEAALIEIGHVVPSLIKG